MGTQQKADLQLTANVIIVSTRDQVLLTRYDDEDERMWIPGALLNEYEHPDAAAARAVVDVGATTNTAATLHHIESFRGRRGWHVMFNYVVRLDMDVTAKDAAWFDAKQLPPTAHGEWERGVIAKVLNAR